MHGEGAGGGIWEIYSTVEWSRLLMQQTPDQLQPRVTYEQDGVPLAPRQGPLQILMSAMKVSNNRFYKPTVHSVDFV